MYNENKRKRKEVGKMKYLKLVNKINTYALGIFFVALSIGMIRPNDFETLLIGSAIILFFITFICGGLTFSCANRVAVNMETADLSVVPKRRMIILTVICVSEIAAMLLFIQNSIVIWAIGVLVISYFFTAQEYCIIPEIEKSEKFKVSFPVFLVPFAVLSVFVNIPFVECT